MPSTSISRLSFFMDSSTSAADRCFDELLEGLSILLNEWAVAAAAADAAEGDMLSLLGSRRSYTRACSTRVLTELG